MEELIKELYEEWAVADHLTEAEFIRFVRDSHRALVENARLGQIIFYGELPVFEELKERFGDDVSAVIGYIVGACSEYETSRNRPSISAIVINQESHQPGRGFYGLSMIPYHLCQDIWEEQGKYPPEIVINKRQEFWLSELQQTLEYWGKYEVQESFNGDSLLDI